MSMWCDAEWHLVIEGKFENFLVVKDYVTEIMSKMHVGESLSKFICFLRLNSNLTEISGLWSRFDTILTDDFFLTTFRDNVIDVWLRRTMTYY